MIKGKGSFYTAQYPVRWTAQSASHFLPSLTDLFIPTPFSASPGSILARQQLRAKTKSLTFPPLSIARLLIYTAESTGASMERTKMPNLRNSTKEGFEPGLTLRDRHDCESDILSMSYRAPLIPYTILILLYFRSLSVPIATTMHIFAQHIW